MLAIQKSTEAKHTQCSINYNDDNKNASSNNIAATFFANVRC